MLRTVGAIVVSGAVALMAGAIGFTVAVKVIVDIAGAAPSFGLMIAIPSFASFVVGGVAVGTFIHLQRG